VFPRTRQDAGVTHPPITLGVNIDDLLVIYEWSIFVRGLLGEDGCKNFSGEIREHWRGLDSDAQVKALAHARDITRRASALLGEHVVRPEAS
jgi:hypothetical protein